MSPQMVTDMGYTKFNLTYPLATDDTIPMADLMRGYETIPNALIGILVPHIFCTLIILARTYSRLFLLRKWFLDDTLILLAWAFTTSVCIIYSIAVQAQSQQTPYGGLNLLATTTATPIAPTTTRAYISLILYQLALFLTKLSILSFYHRIFSPS